MYDGQDDFSMFHVYHFCVVSLGLQPFCNLKFVFEALMTLSGHGARDARYRPLGTTLVLHVVVHGGKYDGTGSRLRA